MKKGEYVNYRAIEHLGRAALFESMAEMQVKLAQCEPGDVDATLTIVKGLVKRGHVELHPLKLVLEQVNRVNCLWKGKKK